MEMGNESEMEMRSEVERERLGGRWGGTGEERGGEGYRDDGARWRMEWRYGVMEMREGDEYGERDGGREGVGAEEFNECTLRTLNRKAGALVALKSLNGSTDFF